VVADPGLPLRSGARQGPFGGPLRRSHNASEVGRRAQHEPAAGGALLVGEHLLVRIAGMIVDRHVQEVVAMAPMEVGTVPPAVNPVPAAERDPSELHVTKEGGPSRLRQPPLTCAFLVAGTGFEPVTSGL
jgi:hypothetical protein